MGLLFAIALRILTNAPVSTSGVAVDVGYAAVGYVLSAHRRAIVGSLCGAAWMIGARLWPGQLLVAAAAASMVMGSVLTGARGLGGSGPERLTLS